MFFMRKRIFNITTSVSILPLPLPLQLQLQVQVVPLSLYHVYQPSKRLLYWGGGSIRYYSNLKSTGDGGYSYYSSSNTIGTVSNDITTNHERIIREKPLKRYGRNRSMPKRIRGNLSSKSSSLSAQNTDNNQTLEKSLTKAIYQQKWDNCIQILKTMIEKDVYLSNATLLSSLFLAWKNSDQQISVQKLMPYLKQSGIILNQTLFTDLLSTCMYKHDMEGAKFVVWQWSLEMPHFPIQSFLQLLCEYHHKHVNDSWSHNAWKEIMDMVAQGTYPSIEYNPKSVDSISTESIIDDTKRKKNIRTDNQWKNTTELIVQKLYQVKKYLDIREQNEAIRELQELRDYITEDEIINQNYGQYIQLLQDTSSTMFHHKDRKSNDSDDQIWDGSLWVKLLQNILLWSGHSTITKYNILQLLVDLRVIDEKELLENMSRLISHVIETCLKDADFISKTNIIRTNNPHFNRHHYLWKRIPNVLDFLAYYRHYIDLNHPSLTNALSLFISTLLLHDYNDNTFVTARGESINVLQLVFQFMRDFYTDGQYTLQKRLFHTCLELSTQSNAALIKIIPWITAFTPNELFEMKEMDTLANQFLPLLNSHPLRYLSICMQFFPHAVTPEQICNVAVDAITRDQVTNLPILFKYLARHINYKKESILTNMDNVLPTLGMMYEMILGVPASKLIRDLTSEDLMEIFNWCNEVSLQSPWLLQNMRLSTIGLQAKLGRFDKVIELLFSSKNTSNIHDPINYAAFYLNETLVHKFQHLISENQNTNIEEMVIKLYYEWYEGINRVLLSDNKEIDKKYYQILRIFENLSSQLEFRNLYWLSRGVLPMMSRMRMAPTRAIYNNVWYAYNDDEHKKKNTLEKNSNIHKPKLHLDQMYQKLKQEYINSKYIQYLLDDQRLEEALNLFIPTTTSPSSENQNQLQKNMPTENDLLLQIEHYLHHRHQSIQDHDILKINVLLEYFKNQYSTNIPSAREFEEDEINFEGEKEENEEEEDLESEEKKENDEIEFDRIVIEIEKEHQNQLKELGHHRWKSYLRLGVTKNIRPQLETMKLNIDFQTNMQNSLIGKRLVSLSASQFIIKELMYEMVFYKWPPQNHQSLFIFNDPTRYAYFRKIGQLNQKNIYNLVQTIRDNNLRLFGMLCCQLIYDTNTSMQVILNKNAELIQSLPKKTQASFQSLLEVIKR